VFFEEVQFEVVECFSIIEKLSAAKKSELMNPWNSDDKECDHATRLKKLLLLLDFPIQLPIKISFKSVGRKFYLFKPHPTYISRDG
jgi:hypothetical protein